MHKLGEQWIEVIDGKEHMLKAVEGPKIVNGLMEGNTCHGCCYVDKWDDDCLNPNQACPVGKGVIIKDLGPVNEDGCTFRFWCLSRVYEHMVWALWSVNAYITGVPCENKCLGD